VLEFTGSASMGLPRDEEALRRALQFIDAGLADGRFAMRIDRRFALAEAAEAHAYLERGAHAGKVVLTV